MLIFADETDLSPWLSADPPDNTASLLRSASLLVSEATQADYYDVDGTGLPTDGPTLQAFNDATCAQAAMWIASNIDPAAEGLVSAGVLRVKRIGTASLEYDTAGITSAALAQQRLDAATSLCDASRRILQVQNLAKTSVWTYG